MRTVIFGASGDLGAALADSLAARGHQLILHGHDHAAKLEEVATRVGAEQTYCVDVTSESAVREMFDSIGGLDGVVYCVGVNPRADDVATLAVDVWRRTLDVNLTGAFIVTKHAIAALK